MRESLRRAVMVVALLTCFGVLGSGGAAHSDETKASAPPPQAIVRDVKAIKAALETLKARLNDVELDALQRDDQLESFREELASVKSKLGVSLQSHSRSLNAAVAAPHEGYASLPRDVATTGGLSQVAPIPTAAVVPHARASAPPGGRAVTGAEDKQVEKAEALLRLGDVAGARLVLERALQGKNPAVAFKLAETYDPQRLAAWHVIGVRGDAQKARELYEQAKAGGLQ
jgi:hypothetical protein